MAESRLTTRQGATSTRTVKSLSKTAQQIQDRKRDARRMTGQRGWPVIFFGGPMIFVGHEQHHAILEAVERRQGTRAEALAREHAQLSRNLEISLTDEQIRDHVPGAPLIQI